MLKRVLSRPYPFEHSHYIRISNALIFGFFVFSFLYILQPFQIDDWLTPNKALYLLGYGLITTGCMLFLSYLFPLILPRFFSEASWNVGREIGMVLFHVLFIASFNLLYSHWIGLMELHISTYLNFIWITMLVAVFPVSVITLLNYNRLLRKHIREAGLASQMVQSTQNPEINVDQLLVILSENQHVSLPLSLQQLLFIQSADNYIEVVYLHQHEIQRTLIRNTLKRLEELFLDYPSLYRCHRSYLVNLSKVEKVSGNSLGLKLHLKDFSGEIPVSRSLNHEIEERIKVARLKHSS